MKWNFWKFSSGRFLPFVMVGLFILFLATSVSCSLFWDKADEVELPTKGFFSDTANGIRRIDYNTQIANILCMAQLKLDAGANPQKVIYETNLAISKIPGVKPKNYGITIGELKTIAKQDFLTFGENVTGFFGGLSGKDAGLMALLTTLASVLAGLYHSRKKKEYFVKGKVEGEKEGVRKVELKSRVFEPGEKINA